MNYLRHIFDYLPCIFNLLREVFYRMKKIFFFVRDTFFRNCFPYDFLRACLRLYQTNIKNKPEIFRISQACFLESINRAVKTPTILHRNGSGIHIIPLPEFISRTWRSANILCSCAQPRTPRPSPGLTCICFRRHWSCRAAIREFLSRRNNLSSCSF